MPISLRPLAGAKDNNTMILRSRKTITIFANVLLFLVNRFSVPMVASPLVPFGLVEMKARGIRGGPPL